MEKITPEAHLTTYNRMNVKETYMFSLQDKNTHALPLGLPTEISAHIFPSLLLIISLWFPPSDSAHVVLPNNYLTHRYLTSPFLQTKVPTTDLFSCEMLFGRAWHCKNCRFTFHPLLRRKTICLKPFHFQQGEIL